MHKHLKLEGIKIMREEKDRVTEPFLLLLGRKVNIKNSIYLTINEASFSTSSIQIEHIEIFILLLGRMKASHCLFYEWSWDL